MKLEFFKELRIFLPTSVIPFDKVVKQPCGTNTDHKLTSDWAVVYALSVFGGN